LVCASRAIQRCTSASAFFWGVAVTCAALADDLVQHQRGCHAHVERLHHAHHRDHYARVGQCFGFCAQAAALMADEEQQPLLCQIG
jgi:hypothetical protein